MIFYNINSLAAAKLLLVNIKWTPKHNENFQNLPKTLKNDNFQMSNGVYFC